MEEYKTIANWIKNHKKELLITGIGIGAGILLILGVKHQEDLKALLESLKQASPKTAVKELSAAETAAELRKATASAAAPCPDLFPIDVSRHVRNLHEGWHASPEKIADAMKNNIILKDGQTWVEGYTKRIVAA